MARRQKTEIAEISPDTATTRKTLFERVAGYLDTNDWNYTAYQEKTYFSMTSRIQDATVRVILDVYEADDMHRVLAYSMFPVFVPELRRGAVAECLTRINYAMAFGNLEMDLKDGEVRVRTVVEATGELGEEMIERALTSNLRSADRYLAPLLAVAFGNARPETILDLVARNNDSTLQ